MIAFNKGRQDRGTEPSGSSISRYKDCPGSYLLELHAQGEDTTSPEADLGNLVHSSLAGSDVQLSDEAAEIKKKLEAAGAKVEIK